MSLDKERSGRQTTRDGEISRQRAKSPRRGPHAEGISMSLDKERSGRHILSDGEYHLRMSEVIP
jgi:hypothetical protein